MARCRSCVHWKKDYGIWAHNAWTRFYSDKGSCLNRGQEMSGRSLSCIRFQAAPPQIEVFYPPVPTSETTVSLQSTVVGGLAVMSVEEPPPTPVAPKTVLPPTLPLDLPLYCDIEWLP